MTLARENLSAAADTMALTVGFRAHSALHPDFRTVDPLPGDGVDLLSGMYVNDYAYNLQLLLDSTVVRRLEPRQFILQRAEGEGDKRTTHLRVIEVRFRAPRPQIDSLRVRSVGGTDTAQLVVPGSGRRAYRIAIYGGPFPGASVVSTADPQVAIGVSTITPKVVHVPLTLVPESAPASCEGLALRVTSAFADTVTSPAIPMEYEAAPGNLVVRGGNTYKPNLRAQTVTVEGDNIARCVNVQLAHASARAVRRSVGNREVTADLYDAPSGGDIYLRFANPGGRGDSVRLRPLRTTVELLATPLPGTRSMFAHPSDETDSATIVLRPRDTTIMFTHLGGYTVRFRNEVVGSAARFAPRELRARVRILRPGGDDAAAIPYSFDVTADATPPIEFTTSAIAFHDRPLVRVSRPEPMYPGETRTVRLMGRGLDSATVARGKYVNATEVSSDQHVIAFTLTAPADVPASATADTLHIVRSAVRMPVPVTIGPRPALSTYLKYRDPDERTASTAFRAWPDTGTGRIQVRPADEVEVLVDARHMPADAREQHLKFTMQRADSAGAAVSAGITDSVIRPGQERTLRIPLRGQFPIGSRVRVRVHEVSQPISGEVELQIEPTVGQRIQLQLGSAVLRTGPTSNAGKTKYLEDVGVGASYDFRYRKVAAYTGLLSLDGGAFAREASTPAEGEEDTEEGSDPRVWAGGAGVLVGNTLLIAAAKRTISRRWKDDVVLLIGVSKGVSASDAIAFFKR